MRNNGKKRTTILVAALLALVMTLSLTACQVEIPGVGTININGGNTPTGGQVPGGNGTGGDEPGAYDDSLDLLRQELDERHQDERFAVAYIGDIDGSLRDLAVPLRDWINDTAPGLCAQYTFVRNIPQERVVGDSGSLFCVVPRDPDATVVVNRIQWSEAKGDYEVMKKLYRSQNGEPILLFVFVCPDPAAYATLSNGCRHNCAGICFRNTSAFPEHKNHLPVEPNKKDADQNQH